MTFQRVTAYLEQAVAERLIPGAVLRIEHAGELVHETAVGLRHTMPELPMRVDTVFDLASLTKVVATAGTLLTLFEADVINPQQTLGEFLPLRPDKQRITLEQCLTHTSGLPALVQLQHSVMEIDDLELEYQPGTQVIYSDPGYLLLGRIIEVVTGEPLDVATRRRVVEWGMLDTMYNPTDTQRCAATEWRDALGRHQWGEVHDENATALGGIAGHAGVFSTARDLATFARMFLQPDAPRWFMRSRRNCTQELDDSRGLGWAMWEPGCSASDRASPDAFGHTGFTGTSMWIDPQYDLIVVLLTNAVHYGRGLTIRTVRQQTHALIFAKLQNRG